MTNGDDFPQAPSGSRTLKVDGGWGFLELSNFGRQYVHIYSLIHALKAAAGTSGDHEERLRWAFRAFPWRGGWSSVNFFQSLVDAVPNEHKPRIARIEYASPGVIELELATEPAEQTRRIVDAVCRSPSVRAANETYSQLHGDAQRQGLLRRSAKRREGAGLDDERLAFAASAADRLIHVMGLEEYEDQLQQLAGRNPLTLMKVVFALYRKVKPLAELQDAGKVFF